MANNHVHEWLFVERNGAIKIWFCPICGQGKQRIASDVSEPLAKKWRSETPRASAGMIEPGPATKAEGRSLLRRIFGS